MEHVSSTNTTQGYMDLPTVKTAVNEYIENYLSENIAKSQALDHRYGYLWQGIKDQVNAGGKRLRPYFVMLAYSAYKIEGAEHILPIAAAHELLHISLLIHDDIIDNDYTRHGQKNLAGNMKDDYLKHDAGKNAEHYGMSAALLAGDLLISSAYNIITSCDLPEKEKLIALSRLSESIFLVGGGELLDTESSIMPSSNEQALKIADLKTARYSFVIPLITGAELAGVSHAELALLEEFGIALGIAYQLADDLLGVYGDPSVTGKSILSDIREGKQTYLMLQAFAHATPDDKKILQQYVGNPALTEAQAILVQDVLVRTGAKDKCIEQIKLYAAQARRVLSTLSISSEIQNIFESIITRATERNS